MFCGSHFRLSAIQADIAATTVFGMTLEVVIVVYRKFPLPQGVRYTSRPLYPVCLCTQVHTVTFTPPPSPQPPTPTPGPSGLYAQDTTPGGTQRSLEVLLARVGVGRVPTAQGKTGKVCVWGGGDPVWENMEFGNFAKTQGISYSQVVNFLILKIKDIAICAGTFSFFF